MNNYGIFFTKDKTVIRLPMNPEVLPDTLVGNNETYNVLGIGDVTVPRIPQQRVVEIASYFPATITYDVLTPNQFWLPEKYIEFFRSAMQNGDILTYTPVRYMENGKPFATSDPGFKCTVESFNVEERGGETGDFYYTLTIKEYRSYAPQTVKVQVQKKKTTQQQEEKKQEEKKVTVAPARQIPNDEIVVNKEVVVNGPVTQQLTTEPEKPKAVTGKTGIVSRIDTAKEAAYLIKEPLSGGIIGWAVKQSLTPIINNALNTTQPQKGGGGGKYTMMTK